MKKLTALFLALCLLVALCACTGSSTPANTDTPNDANTPADTNTPADAADDANTPDNTDTPDDTTVAERPIGRSGLATSPDPSNPAVTAEPLVLPLATDNPTITFWACEYLPAAYESDFANTQLYNWVPEWTGVNIEVHNASFFTATEQFNLMLVSGATDDIVDSFSSRYPKGGQHAIDEDLILDLTDYVAKYMPNYQAMRALSDTHTRMSVTDEGSLAYIYKMDYEQEVDWQGMNFRSDLLDELGLALPETYDDWTEALTAIHDKWGGWISIPTNGIFTNSEFASGYGIGTQWYVVDGEVRYGAVQEEYKQYLALLRDWFNAGFIDKDFVGRSYQNQVTWGRQDCVGGTYAWGRSGPNHYLWNEAADYETDSYFMSGLPHAVLNKGDTPGRVCFKASVVRNGTAILPAAEDPVLCAKFLDYFYSDEGAILINYGPIGQSCELDEDGNVHMTAAYDAEVQERIDDGTFTKSYAWEGLIYNWNWHEANFGVMKPERLLLQYDDLSAWEQCLEWAKNSGEWNYPEGTQMTAEEAEEYARIYADASTMIGEFTTKIICGMVDLEEGYSEMLSQLDSINFSRAIECKQEALNRFNAR